MEHLHKSMLEFCVERKLCYTCAINTLIWKERVSSGLYTVQAIRFSSSVLYWLVSIWDLTTLWVIRSGHRGDNLRSHRIQIATSLVTARQRGHGVILHWPISWSEQESGSGLRIACEKSPESCSSWYSCLMLWLPSAKSKLVCSGELCEDELLPPLPPSISRLQ